jgi:hypothetical protein
MAGPLFRLQIVDQHGTVVLGPFGPIERDLIQLVPRGLRWLVRRSLGRAIQDLKDQTRYVAARYR